MRRPLTGRELIACLCWCAGPVRSNPVQYRTKSWQLSIDWVPTLLAAASEEDIVQKLKKGGHRAAGKTFKVHLDDHNFLPRFSGEEKVGPRKSFLYFNDNAQLTAIRYDRWKLVFMEQRAEGFAVWREPFTMLRAPKLFDLRMDPFERADEDSMVYEDWWSQRVGFMVGPAQQFVGSFLMTLAEFPPSQRPASFNLDDVMKQILERKGMH